MPLRFPIRFACTATLLALPAVGQEAAPAPFRYEYRDGASGAYRLAFMSALHMDRGGTPVATLANVQLSMRFTIVKVAEDGAATLQHECTGVNMTVEHPMAGTIELDSANADSAEDAGMFTGVLELIGQKMSMQVDATGRCSEVSIPDRANEALAMTGIQLDVALAQLTAPLPATAIEVGAHWTTAQEETVGQGGRVPVSVANELRTHTGSTLTIEQRLQLDLDEVPMEATVKHATATLEVDLTEGVPRTVRRRVELDLTAEQQGLKIQSSREMVLSRIL
ncbi:MAG: hypothetical protein AAF628_35750 [Planctomycetota bacterium]